MLSVDFESVRACVDVPDSARLLLSKCEKRMSFSLNLIVSGGGLVETDAHVVYHNTARGPAKGGLRIWPTVTLESTCQLAELMTYKTALVRIPFGGGKSGIRLDAGRFSRPDRVAILKEYVHMIAGELFSGAYVPAPDLGSTPSDMAVIYGETHMLESVTGKPPRVGGLPGRREATGYGVAHVTALACEALLGKKIQQMRIAVQGFGNVGEWTCRFLRDRGANIVAVSDITGGVFRDTGLPLDALTDHVSRKGGVAGFDGDALSNEELLALDADILIPAAVEKVIDRGNAGTVSARLVVEGANGPLTPEAEETLTARGIPVIPDILANSGGVIASYVEWRQAKSGALTKADETYASVVEQIEDAFHRVRQTARTHQVSLRLAAHVVAVEELVAGMRERGWLPTQG